MQSTECDSGTSLDPDAESEPRGDSVLPLTIFQAIWSVLLGVVAGYWLWRGGTVPGLSLFGFISIYLFLIASLHKRKAWAWWLCWFPPVVSLVLAGPNVIYNFVLYFRDDPLYLDSPGTILVVAVNAILFVIPALCIVALLLWTRGKLSRTKTEFRNQEAYK